MKAREFIRLLRDHDTETDVYCRDSHGYAVPADFGIIIFPSRAVFMVAPQGEVRKAERDLEKGMGKLGRKKIARERP